MPPDLTAAVRTAEHIDTIRRALESLPPGNLIHDVRGRSKMWQPNRLREEGLDALCQVEGILASWEIVGADHRRLQELERRTR